MQPSANLGGIGLGRLVGGFGTFRRRLVSNLTTAGGAVAAVMVVNKIWEQIPELAHPAVKPALKVVAGTVLGPLVAGFGSAKLWDDLGKGVAVGLTLVGGIEAVKAAAPGSALVASIGLGRGDDALLLADGFRGANVLVERVDRNFAGADVLVERVDRNFAGVSSTFNTGM